MKRNVKKIFEILFLSAFVFSGFAQDSESDFKGELYESKKLIVNKGDSMLFLDGSSGNFGFYAIPEQGDPIPLLSKYDSFSSSYFTLKIGRKEYKLSKVGGCFTEAIKTPLGAQMAYLVRNQAEVVVDFSFMPSIPTSTKLDMLRVTVYVINLGDSLQSFALKGLFDTNLGEKSNCHFSSAAHSRINSEMQMLSMDEDLWVRSANKKAAIQFLLNGTGISRPYAVTLGNKDLLSKSTWVPSVQMSKSFNSVKNYNNSALAINWQTTYLDSLKTECYTFYISTATDDNIPAGKKFLADLKAGRAALSANSKALQGTTDIAPSPVLLSSSDANQPLVEDKTPDYEKSIYIGDDNSASLVYNSDVVTEEQLDPEYIQNLIDHIAQLKNEEGQIDEKELARLNSELDSILTKLRSK